MSRIARLRLWHVPLRSHVPYHMAAGKTCDTVETVVVAVETDDGDIGWGEVCPIPHYLPAYARGVAPAIAEIAPALLGHPFTGAEAMTAALDSFLPGHAYAKSPLDIAFWDLMGKISGLPVNALLGGRRIRSLPLYHSITCIAPEEMARIARQAVDEGMTQIQVKLGAEDDWQADVERLHRVRDAVGPGVLVYGDWNCGSTKLDATRVGRAVAELDIMLEQPCATIPECAAVRRATGLPMKLDEVVHDTATLFESAREDCLDAVAVKLSKFGGLSATRRARDLCLHLGAKMCIEDTWGSDIAMTAALHLAASTDPARVLNVCDLSGYVAPRLAPDAPVRHQGRIAVPDAPVWGSRPTRPPLARPT